MTEFRIAEFRKHRFSEFRSSGFRVFHAEFQIENWNYGEPQYYLLHVVSSREGRFHRVWSLKEFFPYYVGWCFIRVLGAELRKEMFNADFSNWWLVAVSVFFRYSVRANSDETPFTRRSALPTVLAVPVAMFISSGIVKSLAVLQ